MFSDKLKLIFIHVPKCAGTSIIREIQKIDPKAGHGHGGWRVYEKIIDKYQSFSIVRNPWDRAYSSYSYALMKKNFWHDNTGSRKNHPDHKRFSNKSFDEVVRDLYVASRKNINIVNGGMYSVHWRFQYQMLFDENENKKINYIFKMEDMDKVTDFLSTYGIDQVERMNTSRDENDDYRNYYSEDSRQMIEEIYEKDIKLFNYEF